MKFKLDLFRQLNASKVDLDLGMARFMMHICVVRTSLRDDLPDLALLRRVEVSRDIPKKCIAYIAGAIPAHRQI